MTVNTGIIYYFNRCDVNASLFALFIPVPIFDLSSSMDLPVLEISCKWNGIIKHVAFWDCLL